MQYGAVFPHNEIGNDPGAIKAYAQGVEALGATHLLIYDHVLGADPDRPGGWKGAYDKDVAFHEPFTTFAFLAGVIFLFSPMLIVGVVIIAAIIAVELPALFMSQSIVRDHNNKQARQILDELGLASSP